MNKKVILGVLMAACAGSTQAMELKTEPYVRLGLGASGFDMSRDSIIGLKVDPEAGSSGFSLAAGIELHRFVSVEVAYFDFGEMSDSTFAQSGIPDGYQSYMEIDRDIDVSLTSLGGALQLHSDTSLPVYVGARLGYQMWDREQTAYIERRMDGYQPNWDTGTYEFMSILRTENYTESDDSSGVYGGLFAAWNSPFGQLGVEYTLFSIAGDKPSMLAGSYTYRF